MARESQSDQLGKLQAKIALAKRFRRHEDYDNTWRRLVDLYRGKHYESISQEDRLLINVCFSTINIIAPSVAVNYPKIAVNARRPEAAAQAVITEAVINYWWKHYKIKPEFRRAVKDFLIVGHGWLKCGYRYVEEEEISQDGDHSDEKMEGNDITPTIIVTEDRPFVERVSPFDVFVDPDCTSMSDARWIAQRVRRTIEEVKTDKRYLKVARDNINATSWNHVEDQGSTYDPTDKEAGYVEIWEYYDIGKKTMCVFGDGSEHFLVKPTDMPYSFGHPYVMIRNYDVPDYFYPMGDLEAIEPLQRELNATRTQMMNHRKRYSRKYLFKESAFDADGRDALESDYDNVLVPVSSDENLNNVVVPFPAVVTPPEFYRQSDIIEGDIQTVSGISEYQRGGLPEIRRTATEAAIVQDAANARAADKLATIEASIAEVAYRLVILAQQFMTGEQVARIVGKDGEPLWVTFDTEYIAGEFDYEVEAGSTAPANDSFRRQMALQMVDAMAPFAGAGIVNMPALAAHVLQFGFGVKNPDQFVTAGPPPMPEQAPAPEQMPPEQMPPEGMPQSNLGAMAPAPDTSQVDPAVIQALISRMGMQLPNT